MIFNGILLMISPSNEKTAYFYALLLFLDISANFHSSYLLSINDERADGKA
ncbi:hypothetical protein ANACAC_01330 [Anaerostipes caccae L1-92]|uniref:Uncharacterized protein n=1 Tax=Anaerostipes caccae (strain DSM 14662 / CCUG 47493 / JCM 13470 / NCIMB 13811 / L1-92) TaxID=411490 RepID=B0MCN7_ANACD|nr:hypothetical protein ANACAC_01330 [Anaerostipes caccae L1-92]